MERIRICFFIGSLKIGGAQKHLVELINCLDTNVFEVFLVIGKDEGGFVDLLSLDRAHILCLDLNKYYDITGLKGLFVLVKYLKKNNISILHSYLFECNIYSAIAYLFIPKMKFIMSIRNMNYTHSKRKIRCTHYASLVADYVTVVCNKVGEFVIEREKINPAKIITLYNAVDKNIFTMTKNMRQESNGEHNLNIACVASLNFRKGHEDLLSSIKILLQRGRKIRLYLLGDGKNRTNLEEIVGDLGLSNVVTFAGYITNVRDMLRTMDIGVLSSYEEGMSNALLEYMAMGLPVVTTDVGGNREVNLDGITGFIIPTRNSELMANALDKLVTNQKLRERMGTEARKRILEEFSIKKMKREYTSFYLEKVVRKI